MPFLAGLQKAEKERIKVKNISIVLCFILSYGVVFSKNQYICKRIAYLDIFYETDKIICAFFMGDALSCSFGRCAGECCENDQ